MNRKGSVLIIGIYLVVVLMVLSLLVGQVVQFIDLDVTAGKDAATLTEIKQNSYKQRFFIEIEAKEILGVLSTEYLNEVQKTVIDSSLPEERLKALEFLNANLNDPLNGKISLYNEALTASVFVAGELAINENKWSLSESEGVIHGFASGQQKISIERDGVTQEYYYFPHFNTRNDLFSQIENVFNKRDDYKRCFLSERDESLCLGILRDNNPEEEFSMVDGVLFVNQFRIKT